MNSGEAPLCVAWFTAAPRYFASLHGGPPAEGLRAAHEHAMLKMEIAAAAAVGDLQKLMGEKITEAYKEGQRDAHRLMKEMRSFFP